MLFMNPFKMAYSIILVEVVLGLSIFAGYAHPIGIDIKQPICCVSKEVVLDLVSNIKDLSQKVSVLEKDFSSLNEQLQNQMETNRDIDEQLQKQIKINRNMGQRLNDVYEILARDSQSDRKTAKTKSTDTMFNATRPRVKRQESEKIAFSAYVDHEERFLRKDQSVQFQNVILNDGNAYNNFTGIFTAPRSGVYMLIFFVEDYHEFQSIFHIVVNRNIITSAIADPLSGQNVQGGNVVLVHLNAGESAWVSVGDTGDNIEGYDQLRTSTFSGYLVYE